mgnify:CR=1 FL=1
MASTNCDMCVNYVYDEDYECYTCLVNLDEDEMERLASSRYSSCPYYKFYDEYKTVQKQN